MQNDYLGYRLRDFYGSRGTKDGDIGLEFECEGSLSSFNTSQWTCKPDGSLRNGGIEWVTHGAIPMPQVEACIKNWFYHAARNACKFDNKSPRTSVHVHVNAKDLVMTQIYNVITAYWLVENLLCKFAGPRREGNLFCLRVKDADYVLQALQQGILSNQYFSTVSSNDYKYGALNLRALSSYGSFEFRMMRGKYDDADYLVDWVEALYSLVHKAAVYESPKAVVLAFKQMNPREFLKEFFAEKFVNCLIKEIPEYYPLMEENFHYAFSLACTLDDWSWKPKEEEKPREVRLRKPVFGTEEDSQHLLQMVNSMAIDSAATPPPPHYTNLGWTTNTVTVSTDPDF